MKWRGITPIMLVGCRAPGLSLALLLLSWIDSDRLRGEVARRAGPES